MPTLASTTTIDAPRRPRRDAQQNRQDVFRLLAKGYSNRQVAARLGLSLPTVKRHRRHGRALLAMLELHRAS